MHETRTFLRFYETLQPSVCFQLADVGTSFESGTRLDGGKWTSGPVVKLYGAPSGDRNFLYLQMESKPHAKTRGVVSGKALVARAANFGKSQLVIRDTNLRKSSKDLSDRHLLEALSTTLREAAVS
jgi:hypothetical protein